MKPVVRCLLAGSMLTLVGCSSASASASHPITADYLAVLDGSVSLLQLTDAAGTLDGTMQSETESGQAPNEIVNNDTEPLTGTITGSTIQLSVDNSPEIFGKLSKGNITLNVPQNDGSLQGIVYQQSDNAHFNTALGQLQTSVSNDNETATEQASAAAAQAAAAAAQQTADNAVNSAANSVTSDISSVASDVSTLGSDVQSVGSDVATTATDLATTNADDQSVITEQATSGSDSGGTCNDAAGVANDAAGVSNDAAGIENDVSGVQGDITTLQSDLSTLQSDWGTLQSDETAAPEFMPPGIPGQADVTQANSQVTAALASAKSTTNGNIDKTNGQVAAAYAAANQANNVASCGSPASSPAPLAHI